MQSILNKYATLLVDYSLYIKKGEKLYIRSTTKAEPLIKEIYREAIKRGAHVEIDLSFEDKMRIFMQEGSDEQLVYQNVLYKHAMETFDAYLFVRAPYNLIEDQGIDPAKRKLRSNALKSIGKTFSKRNANKEIKRSLCEYPTETSAQAAGMSLEEYQQFIYNACHLFADDPAEEWRKIGHSQQKIVDVLNTKDKIRYQCKKTDITFSVKDRIWINSDGKKQYALWRSIYRSH